MASEPLRLRILKAMQTALEEITPANGYALDLSSSVFRGRNVFGDSDPVPLVSVLEAPDPINPLTSPKDSGDQKGNWALLIQGFAVDDPEHPTDPAYVLMADVIKRLAIEKRKLTDYKVFGSVLGRTIVGMELGTRVVRPPDESSNKAYFNLSVILDVVESLTDPYED